MLLLLILVVSFLLILVTKTSRPRDDKFNDLVSITDYFKATFEQSPANDDNVDVSAAIRHLDTVINMKLNPDKHDGVLRLETALLALKSYPKHDKIIALALTVILSITNMPSVAQQKFQVEVSNNDDDLQFIIDCLQSSLSRAKSVDEPLEKDERLSAEIQRRGCLFLGGFAESANVARDMVVEKGGLNLIIEAVQWYRFHAGVCKWGLWAAFHICYDRMEHQTCLVNKNGIQAVCESIKNNVDSVDLTRHGIAILFDIMKGNTEVATQAMAMAFQEGLHDLLMKSIHEYPEDKEICMMSQQILGTSNTILTPSNSH